MVSVNTTQLCVHEHYRWNVVVTVPQHGGFRFNVQAPGGAWEEPWGNPQVSRVLGDAPCTSE